MSTTKETDETEFKILIQKIKDEINKLTKYRKEHADTYGEVFTEFYLIEEHVSNIDPELFKDPTSTFLDPCAGFGSYSIVLIEKLMEGLKDWEPNPEKRWKHILENQIFMVELQKDSCEIIERLLIHQESINWIYIINRF